MADVPDVDALLRNAAERWFGDLADRGIIVTDDALVIRGWNAWLAEQTGIRATDAIGQQLFVISPTIRARGLDEHYRRALGGEVRLLAHQFHKFLIPVRHTDSATARHETTQTTRILPLTSGDRVVGTITIIEDVSERLERERELRSQIAISERARTVAEEASRLKDEFLATLSHEIRTPLNAVLGWTQILRVRNDPESRARALDVIERNATSQLRLVEDLLDMARIVSGKLGLDLKSTDIRSVVQAAIDVVEPTAAANGVSIRTAFCTDDVVVSADSDRIQQAIWNVLSNAVKFTPSGGLVEVRLGRSADVVRIDVVDSGQGISAEFLPYVFDRFRQADGSSTRRHGGLGLGLALTRQIVGMHGGVIDVESAGVDQGAHFSIRLPVSDTPAPAAISPRPTLSGESLKGINVLFVDDSEDSRDMLELALRSYGAEVRASNSAQAAMELLTAGAFVPDILVSDIGMPGSDGYVFIRQVHAVTLPTQPLPAIALTGYAEPGDRVRSLAAGYQLHLPKPADPSVVAESIRNLVAAARSGHHK